MDQPIDMSLPVISVILPVFNGGEFLETAVLSILDQSFTRFEFIIINDGSTDESSSTLRRLAAKDSRIKLVERENKGLVNTLNEGISLSKGSFIARMDADDISHPDRLGKQLQLLEEKNADICGSHYLVISNENKKLIPVLCPLTEQSTVLHLGASSVPFPHGSVVFRKSFLTDKKLRYTSESLAEDYNLWVSFHYNKAKFVNVDEFLFNYRLHSGSITGSINSDLRNAGKKIGYNFIRKNPQLYEQVVIAMLSEDLTEFEEVSMVIAAHRLFKLFRKNLYVKVLKKVSSKSKVLGLIKIMSGRA